ncbi:hypothetical protein L6452_06145 [Arctium lappa]|uniref:Uncharacterized protein n=1 Tax=Arctium lappa TaxID=4217 RepID=A0ACB9EJ13_ARCLA|nr:hypothetical protein L6452_06145 [Arctium lappa]
MRSTSHFRKSFENNHIYWKIEKRNSVVKPSVLYFCFFLVLHFIFSVCGINDHERLAFYPPKTDLHQSQLSCSTDLRSLRLL